MDHKLGVPMENKNIRRMGYYEYDRKKENGFLDLLQVVGKKNAVDGGMYKTLWIMG